MYTILQVSARVICKSDKKYINHKKEKIFFLFNVDKINFQ